MISHLSIVWRKEDNIHELSLKNSLKRTDNSEAMNYYTFNCKGDNLRDTE